ncbi:MAG: hypothetical protein NUV97_01035 [archaeon]|nr:hypothetical protein [archaeon]MCR4323456.1 hypothetical protein [Nanoarchaeota archaeon]
MSFALPVIVLIAFIIAGLFFLKTEHQFRKVKIVLIILLGFFLYFSIVSVFTSETVDLSSPGGVVKGVYLYFGWIGRAVGNLWDVGVDTTGAVVRAVKINRTDG